MATDPPAAASPPPPTGGPARLDAELVRRGLARSRGQAQELVRAGTVEVEGAPARKPSLLVRPDAALTLATPAPRWVGRAAYKLLAALEELGPRGLTVTGKRCLDVGASTGGFTQVLLHAGAAHVTALDVGHGQLAAEVAEDPRVTERSGTNIRDVGPGDLGPAFDLVVADLSFISLRLVLDPVAALLTEDADGVLLVKPQFEVGRERLARTGVVTSDTERRRALDAVTTAAADAGLRVLATVRSPLPGATGNQEYLLWVTTRRPDVDDPLAPAPDAPEGTP